MCAAHGIVLSEVVEQPEVELHEVHPSLSNVCVGDGLMLTNFTPPQVTVAERLRFVSGPSALALCFVCVPSPWQTGPIATLEETICKHLQYCHYHHYS